MRSHTLVALALAAAACSSSDKTNASAGSSAGASSTGGGITFTPSLGVDLSTMKRTPSGAWYKDIVEGAGAPVSPGQQAAIHYDGHLPNGVRFDQNGPQDQPFAFPVGAGAVVKGFDEGVAGMKVGGKRLVVIPPELGYGPNANGPVPANATLVFTIELVAIR
jgi:peptidylprolyl isomerase